jgi:hypothetical protein
MLQHAGQIIGIFDENDVSHEMLFLDEGSMKRFATRVILTQGRVLADRLAGDRVDVSRAGAKSSGEDKKPSAHKRNCLKNQNFDASLYWHYAYACRLNNPNGNFRFNSMLLLHLRVPTE